MHETKRDVATRPTSQRPLGPYVHRGNWLDRQPLSRVAVSALVFVIALLAGIYVFGQMREPLFTVQRDGNLVEQIGYDRAINFAGKTGLPIFVTDRQGLTVKVDYESALHDNTSEYSVNVPVRKGDLINLRFGCHYVPSNRTAR